MKNKYFWEGQLPNYDGKYPILRIYYILNIGSDQLLLDYRNPTIEMRAFDDPYDCISFKKLIACKNKIGTLNSYIAYPYLFESGSIRCWDVEEFIQDKKLRYEAYSFKISKTLLSRKFKVTIKSPDLGYVRIKCDSLEPYSYERQYYSVPIKNYINSEKVDAKGFVRFSTK